MKGEFNGVLIDGGIHHSYASPIWFSLSPVTDCLESLHKEVVLAFNGRKPVTSAC